jgi:hypothetical protein
MFPVILFGCIGVGMAFAVRQMGGTVLQVCKKLLGSISIDFFALETSKLRKCNLKKNIVKEIFEY